MVTPILPQDSREYDILAGAAERVSDLPGLSCEIGLRLGGGSSVIMDKLSPGSTHIAIDPYGGIPYQHAQGESANGMYPNSMRDEALPNLYMFASERGINFLFFCMTDSEFFRRFELGVPVYANGVSSIVGEYRLVHIDGQHSLYAVATAASFFAPRMAKSGEIVFDDVSAYNHDPVDNMLSVGHLFTRVAITNHRAVYRRGI